MAYFMSEDECIVVNSVGIMVEIIGSIQTHCVSASNVIQWKMQTWRAVRYKINTLTLHIYYIGRLSRCQVLVHVYMQNKLP